MINESNTDGDLAKEMGDRLKTRRLNKNLTTETMATAMGVCLNTYTRLESGEGKLVTFIAALRVLGELQVLDSLFPTVPISPMQMLKLAKKRRQRGRQTLSDIKPKGTSTW